MKRGQCEYLVPPDAMFHVDDATGLETVIDNPTAEFCSWALYAAERLKNMPPWVEREASIGHLWRPGDCDGCPCYVPKV
jgi:hypothetical protein